MAGFHMKKDKGAATVAFAFLLSAALPWILYGWLCIQSPTAVTADAAADGVENAPQVTIPSGTKLIALTFDDGPRRSTTTALLDGLAQRGVQATFFLIGSQIEHNEDLILRMEEEGHQIGIHTYDHVKLTGLSQADFNAQVDHTRQILVSLLGHNDFLLRPPYGMTDAGVKAHAEAPIILWSIDPEDWGDQNADREYSLITKEAKDGSIILMHDIFPASVDAALRVVDELHRQGYLFVTVGELYAARGIPLEHGQVYWNGYP